MTGQAPKTTSAPATLRDLRRGQVIAAARSIIAEEGLEALTIGALERRLRFTRGVITYHFDNKDEIVEAVLESALAEIGADVVAELEASLRPSEKVAAALRAMVRGWLERPEAGRIMLSFWGRMMTDPGLRERNARLYATYRGQSALLIAEGRAAGVFPEVSVDAMAALLVGIVIGIVTQAYFEPGAVDVEAAVAEAQAALLARLRIPAPG